ARGVWSASGARRWLEAHKEAMGASRRDCALEATRTQGSASYSANKAISLLFVEIPEAFHYAVLIRTSKSNNNQESIYDDDEHAIDYASADGPRVGADARNRDRL